ncbi:MAG: hypothetical protein KKA22_04020 [Gammaproteobacteria bacterium]|nr:hypothetical protein [Gammaproteobacteria bacterium]MBU1407296.1 hypothetical protein [Gammaproteobacteria bacterium]MBU1531330.1 hypothetical protein [Gammaproteobacteria bacterium]
MSTIKTYVMGQVWDDELKANVYADDTTLKEALAGFPSLRSSDTSTPRQWNPKPYPPQRVGTGSPRADEEDTDPGDELDKLTRARMTLFSGESYKQAFNAVLADNPELKQRYAKGV